MPYSLLVTRYACRRGRAMVSTNQRRPGRSLHAIRIGRLRAQLGERTAAAPFAENDVGRDGRGQFRLHLCESRLHRTAPQRSRFRRLAGPRSSQLLKRLENAANAALRLRIIIIPRVGMSLRCPRIRFRLNAPLPRAAHSARHQSSVMNARRFCRTGAPPTGAPPSYQLGTRPGAGGSPYASGACPWKSAGLGERPESC